VFLFWLKKQDKTLLQFSALLFFAFSSCNEHIIPIIIDRWINAESAANDDSYTEWL